jgi:hypothetical protein
MTGTSSPRLVAPLLAALLAMTEEPSGPSSPGATMKYVCALRHFIRSLDRTGGGVKNVSELQGLHIDAFEASLRETSDPDSQTPYQNTLRVVILLRRVAAEGLANLRPDLKARLTYVANGSVGVWKTLDAYSEYVQQQLRQACRKEIQRTIQRLTMVVEERLARGGDPRTHGWSDPDNVLWEIDRGGGFSEAQLRLHTSHGVAAALNIRELHRTLYPTQRDLAPFVILLMLDMDIEPECLRELRSDCLQNAAGGWVDVEWRKRRARGNEHRTVRVRDKGSTTPGGIIRLVLTLTRRVRAHHASNRLWICLNPTSLQLCEANLRRQPSAERDFLDQFTAEHNILADDGSPFVLNDLRRLRKSYKQSRYRLSGGQLGSLTGHTREVAANHYADIPALRDTHEKTVESGAWDALRPAQMTATVVPPDEEMTLRGNAIKAALHLGVSESTAARLLEGHLDSFTAACSGFYDSPWGEPGEGCPAALWGCLECRNAVITSRKLPNILLLLQHTLEQREVMDENAWAAKWGRTYLSITVGILPSFPHAVVAEARAIAESGEAAMFLPPELLGH